MQEARNGVVIPIRPVEEAISKPVVGGRADRTDGIRHDGDTGYWCDIRDSSSMGVMSILDPKFGGLSVATNIPEGESLSVRFFEKKWIVRFSPIPWTGVNAVESFLLSLGHRL